MQSSQNDYKKYLALVTRNKERFIILALVIMTLVFVVSYLLPRKYEATSTVFIEKNVISELVKGITVSPSMEDTINVLTYAITSRTLITKVIDSLDMNVSKGGGDTEALIKKFQKNTTVKMKEKSNQFTISFADSNPKLARDFVNTLVRVYIEENVTSKRGESYDATKFLTEQIDTFNTKLEKAETAVNTYKRDKGGVISVDEGKLFQEIAVAQQKLYDLALRRRQLEGMRQVTQKNNDPLQSKLAGLQKKLVDLQIQYTDSYPEVVTVKGDIETVKEQLKTRKGEAQPLAPEEMAKIESEISAIKVTEEGLRRYVSTNKNLLQSIPTARAGMEKLELEQKNQKNIYDQLYTRRGQSEVSKQMEVQDKSTTFRVIDPAILPVQPASPDRFRIMLMGILGSIAGSFGILFLLDQMDGSVKDADTVKEFGLPVLAIIPKMEEPLVVARQRRKFLRLTAVAALYFLVMLCFPVMEFMQVPYMDNLLDKAYSVLPQVIK